MFNGYHRSVGNTMKFDKSNIVGIVALLGAILLIAGVFLTWVDVSFSSLIVGTEQSYSGWEVYQNEDGRFDDIGYGYAPLVALVAGILALITTIVPMFYQNDSVWRILGVVSLILGIVAVILGFLFNGDVSDGFSLGGLVSASIDVGTGLWISVAGGILLILGAVVDIAKKHT